MYLILRIIGRCVDLRLGKSILIGNIYLRKLREVHEYVKVSLNMASHLQVPITHNVMMKL